MALHSKTTSIHKSANILRTLMGGFFLVAKGIPKFPCHEFVYNVFVRGELFSPPLSSLLSVLRAKVLMCFINVLVTWNFQEEFSRKIWSGLRGVYCTDMSTDIIRDSRCVRFLVEVMNIDRWGTRKANPPSSNKKKTKKKTKKQEKITIKKLRK